MAVLSLAVKTAQQENTVLLIVFGLNSRGLRLEPQLAGLPTHDRLDTMFTTRDGNGIC
jgi:hypothetical protein